MKVLLGILFLLFASYSVCHSQVASNDTVQLTKLSPEGILLNKGWKFYAGDEPQWAKPDFDDSKWKSADPGTDITKFDLLKNSGVGWLRLHIRADSAIAG